MSVKNEMKINLRDIPLEGLDLACDISQELIGERKDDDFHFIGPLKMKAHVEKLEDTVIARANVESKYSSICSRCLEESQQDWSKEYILDFPVEKKTEFIDMTDEIRQEVILSFPARTLCKPDCKGLCLGCGVNLNKEECKCKNNKE